MKSMPLPKCHLCASKPRRCQEPNVNAPAFCPTVNLEEITKEANREFENPEIRKFATNAILQEAEGYGNRDVKPYVRHPIKTRVQEICEFAQKMEYKKIGVAFCNACSNEGRIFSKVLEAQGFEVASACCKAGCSEKEILDITNDQKVKKNEFEVMCNPILQAKLLNAANTDFNVLLGLCVGHDSLFFKYSQAMTTVLFAKDRLLGHNPVAALHTIDTYYERLLKPGFAIPKEEETK